MSNRPQVLLVLPPQWTPQNPPFALASLGGHLRSQGFSVKLIDLNLRYYLTVLRPAYLTHSRNLALMRHDHLVKKCQMRLSMGDRDSSALQQDSEHILRLDSALERSPDPWAEAARAIPEGLEVLRDRDRFYQPELLMDALAVVDQALELVALPYHPARLALNDYRQSRDRLTVSGLERSTRDPWTNPFLAFLKDEADRLLAVEAPIVAISINSFSQVTAGLTLARLLRERGIGHLNLGGNFFGRIAHRLEQLPEFFGLFGDSLVIGEGEDKLARLCRTVLSGTPITEVPATMFLDAEGRVRRNPEDRLTPLTELGYVDLEDLDLEAYLTPEPVVCVQGSRGCYWARCSFCDAYWGVDLDKKSPARVVSELEHLNNRYGIRHFEFVDECQKPQEMQQMATAIRESGLDIRWFANARTEDGFVTVVDGLAEAGLTMLLWGFESGSQRILKRIIKGVGAQRRWEVLRAAAAAGIWNFAYIFFGFPGETDEDAQQTIDAIRKNTDIIHSYGRSIFSLGRHSPVAKEPEAYGVSEVVEGGEELSVNVQFRSQAGPTDDQTAAFAQRCLEQCREAYGSPLWMALRNRENLHLYLARYGRERVAEWKLAELAPLTFQK